MVSNGKFINLMVVIVLLLSVCFIIGSTDIQKTATSTDIKGKANIQNQSTVNSTNNYTINSTTKLPLKAATQPAANSTNISTVNSIIDQLVKLRQLKNDGTITDEEFTKLKEKLI